MVSLQKESEWDFEDELVGYGMERGMARKFLSMQKVKLESFIENLLEQEKKRMSDEIEKLPSCGNCDSDRTKDYVLSIINKK